MHLLLPLSSSLLFVLGMMLAKRAIDRGVSPWTGTFLANIWLAVIWTVIGTFHGSVLPAGGWGQAAVVSLLFVLGQLFTYLAFQHGDVSVAAPILGVKVLIVAILLSLLTGEQIGVLIWIAGGLASGGVILIQTSGASTSDPVSSRKRALTILLALSAATSLSLFDVLMQKWGDQWESLEFLPAMFVMAAAMSVVFLPGVDRPRKLVQTGGARWMLGGTVLMAIQAMGMCYTLAAFGDAARVNIVYSLRGLWGVVLAWLLAGWVAGNESNLPKSAMLRRLAGALLLTGAVVLALSA